MLKLLFTLLLWGCSTFVVFAQSSNGSDPFAGQTFTIDNYIGDHFENSEDLIFSNGQVEGSICVQYGFNLVDYRAWQDQQETWNFSCTMLSETEGKMDWKGTLEDGIISGTYLWTKAGQAPIAFIFSGKQKPAENSYPIQFNSKR